MDGMQVEKIQVINKVGLRFEKAVMKMDREALDAFKALMEVKTDFGSDYVGKSSMGLRCPYYK